VELLLPYLRSHPGGGARVLDVGAGSGYLTSVLYHLVAGGAGDAAQQGNTGGAGARTGTGEGVVVGIEHIPALTEFAERNIRADGLGAALDEQAIVLVTGDGRLGAFFSLSSLFSSSPLPFPPARVSLSYQGDHQIKRKRTKTESYKNDWVGAAFFFFFFFFGWTI
jgi:hypothetical protein